MIKSCEHSLDTLRGLLSSKRQSSRRFAWVLFAFYGFSVVYSLLLLFMPAVQDFAMSRFHLRPRPFAAWSVLQIVPTMYSFENHTEYSIEQSESAQCKIRNAKLEPGSLFTKSPCVRVASPHFSWGYPFREFFEQLSSGKKSARVDFVTTFRGREQRSTLWLEAEDLQTLRGRLSVQPKLSQ